MFKVKDISKMGLMLAMMIAAKFLNSIIPDLPNGLGDAVPMLPLTIVLWSIFMDVKSILFVLSIYMGITWISPHIFISGIEWVYKPINIFGVYMLDYFIPLFALAIMSFKKVYLIPLALLINYFSHVGSGVVFWGDYAWSGWGVWAYSLMANSIQFSILIVITILLIALMRKHSKYMMVQNGYVNDSYKIQVDGKWMQKRVAKLSIANWENEKKVYAKTNTKIEFQENGGFLKEWIPGKEVKLWTNKKIMSLRKAIEEFHALDKKGIINHDWLAAKKYKDNISKELWSEFNELISTFKDHKKVLSHNDINSHNVIWDGNKIHLIDFEWARVNSEYYDYAQFEVAEGVHILPIEMDLEKHKKMCKAIIIFNLLWTYSMPDSKKVNKLRMKYKKMLGN